MIQPYFLAKLVRQGDRRWACPRRRSRPVHRAAREEANATATDQRGRDAHPRDPRPRAAHRRCAHRRGRDAEARAGELVAIIGPNGAGRRRCSTSSPGSSRRRPAGSSWEERTSRPVRRRAAARRGSAARFRSRQRLPATQRVRERPARSRGNPGRDAQGLASGRHVPSGARPCSDGARAGGARGSGRVDRRGARAR